ncbi:MAG: Clp protease N-terminal domain-containing protein [Armatimonadota bacterium]
MEAPLNPAFPLHRLLSAAGTERMVRQSSFDDMEDTYSTSIDLLAAYAVEYPENWSAFVSYLGVSDALIQQRVSELGEDQEPRATRIIIPSEENGLTHEQAEAINENKAPWSQPVSHAMRATVKEAKESQAAANPGRCMQILLGSDCLARTLILEATNEGTLQIATPHLIVEEVETKMEFEIETFMERSRNMIDRLMPKIRSEVDPLTPNLAVQREELFAKNPEGYTTRINLAEHLAKPIIYQQFEFSQRSGGCLSAAENEARIRKAPETTIDHLFFSLMQEGLETTTFLESKGVDWRAWRTSLDSEIPTFEGEGIRFPPKARNLMMNTPSDKVLPPMRSLSEYIDEDCIEQWREDMIDREKLARDRKFSDALWLLGCLEEPKALAYRYLTEAGITVDDVKAITDN